MSNPFFDQPILNSPYECPREHWELDDDGQPTQRKITERRKAKFITPIPKPKKRKKPAADQVEMVFDEGKGISTKEQQYDPTSIINEVRGHVDTWRGLPSSQWQVTETARLLQHWRHHPFASIRPFFCQVEAVETAIWLTEVAPLSKAGKKSSNCWTAPTKTPTRFLPASLSSSPRARAKPPSWRCSSRGRRLMRCAVPAANTSLAGSSSFRPASPSRSVPASSSRTIQTATTRRGLPRGTPG